MAITIYLSQQAQITEAAAGRPAHAKRSYDVPADLVQRVIALGGSITTDGEVVLDARRVTGVKAAWSGKAECHAPRISSFGHSTDLLIDPCPADAEAAVSAVETVIAAARAQWTALRASDAEIEQREAAEREAKLVAERARAAALSDDEILEIRSRNRKATDDDTYYLASDTGLSLAALGEERWARLNELIRERAAAVKGARVKELLAQTRAILHEYAPQRLPRFDAGVLPETELTAVLRGVLLLPFADRVGYELITPADVREAEAAEHADDEDWDSSDSDVEFDVEDVEDGEYTCTAEQWEAITELRKLAAEHGCTATVRLHTGTTSDMHDYVRRLGVRVCCEYAPDKRVCRELAV